MVNEKRWDAGTQNFTGPFIPHESVVSIKWRHIGCLKHLDYAESDKQNLGICEGDGNLPWEGIRICSIQPTEENAQLYDYPSGYHQPRADPSEIQVSNSGLYSRQVELLVPRGQATDVQVLTRRTSNDNNGDPTFNPNSNLNIWEARVGNLDQDTYRVLNPSTKIDRSGLWETEDGDPQIFGGNFDLRAIDNRAQFSASSTPMIIEKNTQFLLPRGGVQPYDTICGIHIPTEPWENIVFTLGHGTTRELIPESNPEYYSRLDLPTHASAVNLRWWRKV